MNDQPAAAMAAAAPRRLTRNSENAVLGGVCSGVAEHFGLDVTLVRLLTVLGVVFGFGSVAVAYIVTWILLPKF
jgi:phage shock protein PspC (stress-responsive transcriptional regulator)